MGGAESYSSSRDAEPSIDQDARPAMSVWPDEIVSSFRYSIHRETQLPASQHGGAAWFSLQRTPPDHAAPSVDGK